VSSRAPDGAAACCVSAGSSLAPQVQRPRCQLPWWLVDSELVLCAPVMACSSACDPVVFSRLSGLRGPEASVACPPRCWGCRATGPPLRPRTSGAERLGPASTDRLRPGEVDSEDNLLQALLADDVPAPTLQRRRSILDCAEHMGQLLVADTMSLVPWVLRTHRLFPTVAAAGQGVRLPSVTFLRGSERRDEHCGTGHWQCCGLQSSAACEGRSAGGGLPSLLSTSPHLFSPALACRQSPAVSGGGCRRSGLPPSIL